MKIADLTTQHYVHNGVPDFHKRMQKRWPLAEVTVFVPAQSRVRRTRADVCRSCCNLHCFFPSWEGISGTYSAAVCVRLVGAVMVA